MRWSLARVISSLCKSPPHECHPRTVRLISISISSPSRKRFSKKVGLLYSSMRLSFMLVYMLLEVSFWSRALLVATTFDWEHQRENQQPVVFHGVLGRASVESHSMSLSIAVSNVWHGVRKNLYSDTDMAESERCFGLNGGFSTRGRRSSRALPADTTTYFAGAVYLGSTGHLVFLYLVYFLRVQFAPFLYAWRGDWVELSKHTLLSGQARMSLHVRKNMSNIY